MYRHSLSSLIIFLSSVITLFFFSGCADDLRNREIFDCGAGDAVIRFSVENVVLTRDGETQDMESTVDHAYLLFYAEDASIDTGVPIAAVRADVDADFPGRLKFKMPLRLQPNTDYQLLAIANADNYVPAGFNNFGEYIESWCGKSSETEYSPILLYHSAPITSQSVENLPMSGGVEGNSVFRFSLDNGAYNVSASLSFRRKVARIDVANIVKDGFKVEGVLLCNWRDAVCASSSDLMLGNSLGSVHGMSADDNFSDDKFITVSDADESGIQQLNNMLYCFPSISYDSYIGDKESTALIIKAKYGSDTQSTYYRVNVGAKGNVSEIKANTKYLVTIQSVEGSGAPTPEEAYAASESPIVLSVVEDWDLEGSNFAMDDNGNFIVVSRSFVEFEGNDTDNVEIGVLTSKGLSWTAEYVPDNEDSASAFSVSSISNSIVIGPKSANQTENTFSGKCRVSAPTSHGNTLTVDIALTQRPSEEKPFEPVIPDDMPFALIPESYDRVKIDHEKRTIEIDGFDPDCFNSFIDIPFKVYINESQSDVSEINVSSTLEWPLEGRISKDDSKIYMYCSDSFKNGSVNSRYGLTTLRIEPTISVGKDMVFNISVGAMGPDDPAITRTLTLKDNNENIEYSLIICPRPVIIDDVILKDEVDNVWMVMDRNIQVTNRTHALYQFACRDSEGNKLQAYNYNDEIELRIPFKYRDNDYTPFSENLHTLYLGDKVTYSNLNSWINKRKDWLSRYVYSNQSDLTSNFYDQDNNKYWVYPNKGVIELCCKKMKMTKMRMYLISDICAIQETEDIPICCYWPYVGENKKESDWYKYGYCIADYIYSNETPNKMLYVYYDDEQVRCYDWKNDEFDYSLSRLVRSLTSEELERYKNNYLGYGSQPHRLILCHPDTYTSEGWIAN